MRIWAWDINFWPRDWFHPNQPVNHPSIMSSCCCRVPFLVISFVREDVSWFWFWFSVHSLACHRRQAIHVVILLNIIIITTTTTTLHLVPKSNHPVHVLQISNVLVPHPPHLLCSGYSSVWKYRGLELEQVVMQHSRLQCPLVIHAGAAVECWSKLWSIRIINNRENEDSSSPPPPPTLFSFNLWLSHSFCYNLAHYGTSIEWTCISCMWIW